MKLFRNSEVIRTFAAYCVVSIAATFISFLFDVRAGILMLAACTAFTFLYLFTTYKRYKRISELTYDIDHILHGSEQISLEKYSEGELGILQSEIYKMTVRLREQQQQLKTDKLYLADSLADISHQIRTPLTSINILVSLIANPDIENEKRQRSIRELYELLSKIEWLITVLLKISKIDAQAVTFSKESISLSKLIEQATAPLLVPIELHGQVLTINACGDFCGDLLWTSEAITNIVKNCIEHTPKNGKIDINATENTLYSEICISDNGSGIAKEDLPHIFERFYKGKNSDEKSFGIGLALSRMIITAQNGTIKAENNASGGAKFTICFYKGVI